MANNARYIRCKVSPGFFDTEFYVILEGSSAFVDRSNVKVQEQPGQGSEVDGEVLAYVIDEAGERALIELSGEPVVGGLRNWISKAEFAGV